MKAVSKPPTFYCHGLPGSAVEISKLVPDGVAAPAVLAPLDLDGFDKANSGAALNKAHIIGFSLGALTALKIASQRPDQVGQVSLIAPAAPLGLGDFLPQMAGRLVFKVAQKGATPFKLFTAFQKLGVAITPKAITSQMFAGSPQADLELLEDQAFYQTLLTGLKLSLGSENSAYRKAISEYVRPWADELSAVTSPITIYHGTQDNWAPIEMAYALQKHLPSGVTVIPLNGFGHYSALHKTLPEILNNSDS